MAQYFVHFRFFRIFVPRALLARFFVFLVLFCFRCVFFLCAFSNFWCAFSSFWCALVRFLVRFFRNFSFGPILGRFLVRRCGFWCDFGALLAHFAPGLRRCAPIPARENRAIITRLWRAIFGFFGRNFPILAKICQILAKIISNLANIF